MCADEQWFVRFSSAERDHKYDTGLKGTCKHDAFGTSSTESGKYAEVLLSLRPRIKSNPSYQEAEGAAAGPNNMKH